MNMMSSGVFGTKFPHATVGGVDAKVGGSYAFMPWLEARASFTYTRVFSSMHPTVEDAQAGYPIAGGALDQYYVGNAGVSAVF
jgi:hypothetical protein